MGPLATYFASNPDKKRIDLAREAGVSAGRITQLCSGDTPSLDLALKIADWTRGGVRPEDWRATASSTSDERAA